MQVQQLTENMKAVIIEVADIFYEMDVEEISENRIFLKFEDDHD